MKVKIIKSDKVAPDCRTTLILSKGEVKEFDEKVAELLIELKIAVIDDGKSNESDNELESLRKEAKELKIKSSHVMGIDKLKEAISSKKEESKENKETNEKALPTLENKAITNIKNKNKK